MFCQAPWSLLWLLLLSFSEGCTQGPSGLAGQAAFPGCLCAVLGWEQGTSRLLMYLALPGSAQRRY